MGTDLHTGILTLVIALGLWKVHGLVLFGLQEGGSERRK